MSIGGLEQEPGEDLYAAVARFFQDILKIDIQIALRAAYKTGKKYPTVHVELLNPNDKGKIFKNVKNLTGVKNKNNQTYRLQDYRTAKLREEKQQIKDIVRDNNARDVSQRFAMEIQKGKLIIGTGEGAFEYTSPLQIPTCKEVLRPTKQELKSRDNINAVCGDVYKFESQEFKSYSVVTQSMEEVKIAYSKIKAANTEARHIICAVRLPGNEFFKNEATFDDDEYGAGKFVLDLLRRSNIENRAIFVVRKYQGEHIGEQRWIEIEKAVTSAVNRSAFNKFTGKHQLMWVADERNRSTEWRRGDSIRGRGRGAKRNPIGPRKQMTYQVPPVHQAPPMGGASPSYAAALANGRKPSADGPPIGADWNVSEASQTEGEESQEEENEGDSGPRVNINI